MAEFFYLLLVWVVIATTLAVWLHAETGRGPAAFVLLMLTGPFGVIAALLLPPNYKVAAERQIAAELALAQARQDQVEKIERHARALEVARVAREAEAAQARQVQRILAEKEHVQGEAAWQGVEAAGKHESQR